MRVLMFGWEFPPYISGGLGTACFGITSGLARRGVEVVFVVPRIKGAIGESHVRLLSASEVPLTAYEPDRESLLERLEVRFLKSSLRPYRTEEETEEDVLLRSLARTSGAERPTAGGGDLSGDYGDDLLGEVVRYGYAAEALAEREVFDVIHGHDWMTVLAGLRARRKSGKPYIYHVHALEFDRSGEHVNRDIYEIERFGLEHADHIIAVSHYTKGMIVRHYGIPEEKVTVVHNGIPDWGPVQRLPFRKRPGEKAILFLGRITFQKGPDYFVEAASLVLSAFPAATFVMAGSGDMMFRMVERVAELRMGMHFLFTGFLRGEEVERIYAASDLYVMPSVSEPFGISPLEAMRCDVPVIISRQSGVAEVLRHALKVDFWDVRDLADKIMAVLRYPVLAEELTARSREEIVDLNWNRAGEKIHTVYELVCRP